MYVSFQGSLSGLDLIFNEPWGHTIESIPVLLCILIFPVCKKKNTLVKSGGVSYITLVNPSFDLSASAYLWSVPTWKTTRPGLTLQDKVGFSVWHSWFVASISGTGSRFNDATEAAPSVLSGRGFHRLQIVPSCPAETTRCRFMDESILSANYRPFIP